MNRPTVMKCGAVILWLCLRAGSASAAESQLRLEADNVDWRGGAGFTYNVFEAGEYAQKVTFRVRLTGAPCEFFVTFGGVGNSPRRAAAGGAALEYEIYQSVTTRTVLRDLPAATASEVLYGAFGSGEVLKEMSYVLLVRPEQVKPSGSYTDQIKITLYRGTLNNYVEQDAKTVVFSIRIDPVSEMSLGEPGAVFDPSVKAHRMDFGALAKGKAKGLDMRVRSNTGYHVTMESENGGVMKNKDSRHPATIPYTLQVGGMAVSLGKAQQTVLSRSHRLTDRNGDLHALSVTIGEVGNAPAGTYQDTLSVTVVSDN